MDLNRWMPVVSIASVIIFFIWGWLDTYQHSWIIFMVAGLAMAVMKAMSKNDDNSGKGGDDKVEW